MMRQLRSTIGLILSIVTLISAAAAAATSAPNLYNFEPTWENLHYTRSIDLNRGYVKETDLIDIKNIASAPQSDYYYTINDGFNSVGNISYIDVVPIDSAIDIGLEEIVPSQVYKLKLPAPVAPGSNIELEVNFVYANKLEPIPKKIKLDEVQQLLYKTNKFPFSPYFTKDYTLVLTGMTKGQEMQLALDDLPDVVESQNTPDLKPRVDKDTLKYGPLVHDIEPFTLKPMGLMYDHNRPMTKVLNLNRSIWIPASDINRVSIEEYYEITNTGAELSSGFSRLEWLKGKYEATRNHWALSHLEIPLKNRNLDDYYYTDKVGVVSSSKNIANFLILQPRFPLFGNWHYNFTLGWSENLDLFLHKSSSSSSSSAAAAAANEYILKFPLLNTVRDATYDDVYIDFYLPEGAEFDHVDSLLPYESVAVDYELSYLDVSKGHVKVTVHFKNLFDDLHKLDLFLTYRYNRTNLWVKVGKIAGFVFVGLVSYYLLNIL
ncbi:OST1 [Candida theae]|uniref:Dolichyl-diphosphooligosaccharide--protein glycosyltransferase subunit 1 n=1 Tax=Candida theae TaxID=1198502 RepID=A0AAD5G0Z8_9ASCO|nr:OST1 [Candida theae]KAI5968475.1 OST1 [Candida theae]